MDLSYISLVNHSSTHAYFFTSYPMLAQTLARYKIFYSKHELHVRFAA